MFVSGRSYVHAKINIIQRVVMKTQGKYFLFWNVYKNILNIFSIKLYTELQTS